MKRLYLLRHAKSSWKHPELDDHDRPLSRRGERAATAMGRHLGESAVRPDLVLCSSARRAVETFERIAPHLPAKFELRVLPGLYATSALGIAAVLREVSPDVTELLLVGHEPALSELTARVAAREESRAWRRLLRKFSTGACAEIHLPVTSWRDLGEGCGRLRRFSRPRDLD